VEVRLLQVDLSDMSSVKKAAEEVNGYKENIDIIINNAAVLRPSP
jgi:short-subunit dehydrogenase